MRIPQILLQEVAVKRRLVEPHVVGRGNGWVLDVVQGVIVKPRLAGSVGVALCVGSDEETLRCV